MALPILLTSCAYRPAASIALPQAAPATLELTGVPFNPQPVDQCGPAALATVLQHTGRPVSVDELRRAVFLPGRRGSVAPEIVAAARRHGALPYRIAPSFTALAAALADGKPVLVLQNLGIPRVPYWHYAVVVGIDTVRGRVLLRSGRDPRRALRIRRFWDSWRWADHWGLVLLEPGGPIPAWVEESRYLEAIAGLELIAEQRAAAAAAYRAASERWPEAALPWLGLGNVAYAAGDRIAALTAWRRAAELEPRSAAIRNNLATVLGELGCEGEGLAQARRALELSAGGPLAAVVERTWAELQQRAAVRSAAPQEKACIASGSTE
ncbi:MAG: PA2778 family cysteine peptidase [Steroidobacteraceae bacterium]|nr:PA2778 family cysteine peptidase [Steroidobacteraceae bacterium]MDW8259048.1 PA2778 family cysteine peptidase [Gammaproteobacteria bacterium]